MLCHKQHKFMKMKQLSISALAMALILTPLLKGTISTASFCASSLNRVRTEPSELLVQRPTERKSIEIEHRKANWATALMSTTVESDEMPLLKTTKESLRDRAIVKDISAIFLHAAFCFASATILCVYEGCDCAYLKPETATIRNFPTTIPTTSNVIDVMRMGTKGMGRGEIDRLDGWYQNTYFGYNENDISDDFARTSSWTTPLYKMRQKLNSEFFTSTANDRRAKVSQNFIREIPSYNEIMEEHRLYRVPTWRRDNSLSIKSNGVIPSAGIILPSSPQSSSVSSQERRRLELGTAVRSVYRALDLVNQLKVEANNYNWDYMRELLETPILRKDLSEGCSLLRGAVDILDGDARREIGFDWGRYVTPLIFFANFTHDDTKDA